MDVSNNFVEKLPLPAPAVPLENGVHGQKNARTGGCRPDRRNGAEGLCGSDAGQHQAEPDQKLTEIVERKIQDPEALLRGLSEGVEDQYDVAYKEGQRAYKEDRGVRGRGREEAARRDAGHEHDCADVEDAEDLERGLGGDLFKDEI